jgi:hypothetical protein
MAAQRPGRGRLAIGQKADPAGWGSVLIVAEIVLASVTGLS